MSELLSQLWTPEMQAAFTVVLVLLVILYVLSIVWVVRDAYLRGTAWYIWAVVSLVPVLGVIAYCARPCCNWTKTSRSWRSRSSSASS
jgi:hypothetical protein